MSGPVVRNGLVALGCLAFVLSVGHDYSPRTTSAETMAVARIAVFVGLIALVRAVRAYLTHRRAADAGDEVSGDQG
jgi:hypothetical protein